VLRFACIKIILFLPITKKLGCIDNVSGVYLVNFPLFLFGQHGLYHFSAPTSCCLYCKVYMKSFVKSIWWLSPFKNSRRKYYHTEETIWKRVFQHTFFNGCITKRCLHYSRNVSYSDMFHACSMMKDESKIINVFCHVLYNRFSYVRKAWKIHFVMQTWKNPPLCT